MRLRYVSHLFPITLPHVKQRTGMIMAARGAGWASCRPQSAAAEESVWLA